MCSLVTTELFTWPNALPTLFPKDNKPYASLSKPQMVWHYNHPMKKFYWPNKFFLFRYCGTAVSSLVNKAMWPGNLCLCDSEVVHRKVVPYLIKNEKLRKVARVKRLSEDTSKIKSVLCLCNSTELERVCGSTSETFKRYSLVFSKWIDFCPIGWIKRIGQNHPCMN